MQNLNKIVDKLSQEAAEYANKAAYEKSLPFSVAYDDKFAELIIKECLKIIDTKIEELVTADQPWTALGAVEDVYDMICERFEMDECDE